jgi:hypothetical protein
MENSAVNIPDFIPVLGHGGHYNPKDGACVMEMVSFIAGEKWSDRPDCVDEGIQEIARNVNDFVSDDNRQVIADMIPRFIGTDALGNNHEKTFEKLLASKFMADPELSVFASGKFPSSSAVLDSIQYHFLHEKDLDKRYTNEHYDLMAMRILELNLDAADEVLGRGVYAVTKEEAFTKIAELPGQRARA